MNKYLIEVDHDPETLACARAVKIFLSTGSHFLTHADWGCMDGVHTAWLIVEEENKDRARAILPPGDRAGARIIGLNSWGLDYIDQLLTAHKG